jgi:predicted ester cyclase
VTSTAGAILSRFDLALRASTGILAEGDRVAFRATSRATHTKDFAGITATGTQIEVGQIGIARVADGMMAEVWNSTDRLGMMQQLGALPAPPAAAR